MGDDRLEQIRAMMEATTPGSWLLENRQDAQLIIRTTDADVAQVFTDDLNGNPEADAAFIATSKSSIGYLLARLDRQQAVVEQFRRLAGATRNGFVSRADVWDALAALTQEEPDG